MFGMSLGWFPRTLIDTSIRELSGKIYGRAGESPETAEETFPHGVEARIERIYSGIITAESYCLKLQWRNGSAPDFYIKSSGGSGFESQLECVLLDMMNFLHSFGLFCS